MVSPDAEVDYREHESTASHKSCESIVPYVLNPPTSLLLRQVHHRLFRMFRRYVRMTRASMLNGLFQLRDACVRMRILAGLQRMLQRGFCIAHDGLGMPLFPMGYRVFRELDGVLTVLVL